MITPDANAIREHAEYSTPSIVVRHRSADAARWYLIDHPRDPGAAYSPFRDQAKVMPRHEATALAVRLNISLHGSSGFRWGVEDAPAATAQTFAAVPGSAGGHDLIRDFIAVRTWERKGRDPETAYLVDVADGATQWSPDRGIALRMVKPAAIDMVRALNQAAAEREDSRPCPSAFHVARFSTGAAVAPPPADDSANRTAPETGDAETDREGIERLLREGKILCSEIEVLSACVEIPAVEADSDLVKALNIRTREMLACIRALNRSPELRASVLERARQIDEEGRS